MYPRQKTKVAAPLLQIRGVAPEDLRYASGGPSLRYVRAGQA